MDIFIFIFFWQTNQLKKTKIAKQATTENNEEMVIDEFLEDDELK